MAGERGGEEKEDDDYMGDLSLFLPPEEASSSSSSQKKKTPPGAETLTSQPPKPAAKRPRGLTWQEQRKIDRERKQREEDERILEGLKVAIPPSNVGFRMLRQMGYSPGSALGKDGSTGPSEPVGLEIRRSRAGIGSAGPPPPREREVSRRQGDREEAKRRREEEELAAEFGSRQKTQWRSRRVVWDYRKAEAALAQLENREVVEPEKERGDEEKKPEEEEVEEEEITEEDLQDILIKLRDEHQYCLYCGYKYESAEALQTNCPGLNEDDH